MKKIEGKSICIKFFVFFEKVVYPISNLASFKKKSNKRKRKREEKKKRGTGNKKKKISNC